ncbi:MAG: CvpA family protein [Pseudomonadota bacterium]
MEFSYVDGGVGAIALVSAIMAYSRGFTREILAITGWLVAAAAAAFLTPMVEPLVREIPVVGGFLGSSCVLSVIAAFTLLMALALLVLSVFTPVFSSFVQDSAIGTLDSILGFVFGVARAALLIAVAYMLYDSLVGDPAEWPPLANAASFQYVVEVATQIQAVLPTELPPFISERIDAMMAPCGVEAGTTPTGEDLPAPTGDPT